MNGHLSFGKILEYGVDQHLTDIFAGELSYISGHKHLAELYFINGAVAIRIEFIKKKDGVRMLVDELLQLMGAYLDHLLLHLLLTGLITPLLFLLYQFSHHRDQLLEFSHRDSLLIVGKLFENLQRIEVIVRLDMNERNDPKEL